MNDLTQQIRSFLNFHPADSPVPFTTLEITEEDGYTRALICYAGGEGDEIPAYLLLPQDAGPFPAVLLHHQHAGQRHFGKSEACGLVGDPWVAFGPALARQGMVVLAPDSICFEDRRKNTSGVEPHEEDTAQHYNELCYRLLRGDTLMRKVLDDSARAVSLLRQHPQVDAGRTGLLGHSYGGSTTLYHAPLDPRIHFAASSGAACSLKQRMQQQTGIEMSQVIPGFAARFDLADLARCMAPRPLLLTSATEDRHSMDAAEIVQEAAGAYAALNAGEKLLHKRYEGKHPLNQKRFEEIVGWLVDQARPII